MGVHHNGGQWVHPSWLCCPKPPRARGLTRLHVIVSSCTRESFLLLEHGADMDTVVGSADCTLKNYHTNTLLGRGQQTAGTQWMALPCVPPGLPQPPPQTPTAANQSVDSAEAANGVQGLGPRLGVKREGGTGQPMGCASGPALTLPLADARLDSASLYRMALTPVHMAVSLVARESVLLLLEHGPDMDAVVGLGVMGGWDIKSSRLPLLHVVESKSLEMAELLIQRSTSVNAQSYVGCTALHAAAGRGLLGGVLRLLLRSGANCALKNYHNDTPLAVASSWQVIDILRGKASQPPPAPSHPCDGPPPGTQWTGLPASPPASLSPPQTPTADNQSVDSADTANGVQGLGPAWGSGARESVLLLLEHGADMDAVDIKSSRLPLLHVVESKSLEMAELLIQVIDILRGKASQAPPAPSHPRDGPPPGTQWTGLPASPPASLSPPRTPTAENQSVDSADAANGVQGLGPAWGLTPVHMAVSLVARESVLLLLEHGPDMDAVDIKSSRLPLLHVVESKSLEMAELLIQRSTSVNVQSYVGCTALHAAAGRGLLGGVLRLLLRSGANCALKNYHNDTPLAVASSWQVIDILRGKASQPPPAPSHPPVGLPPGTQWTGLPASPPASLSPPQTPTADNQSVDSADAANGVQGLGPAWGLTPVHMAVSLVARESVLLLLEHGPDVDAVDIKSSRLPLLHVVESKSLEMAELLIQVIDILRGKASQAPPAPSHPRDGPPPGTQWTGLPASPPASLSPPRTPTAENQSVDSADAANGVQGLGPAWGLTPVHMAVSLVARESVLLLLEHGPDMDAVDIKSSRLPLLHVVESKSLEMAELLIQRSTSVNAQSYAGCTALHAAVGRGLLGGVLRLLLRSGANCALKNYHNDTPLAVASSWQVIDILRGKASQPPPAPSHPRDGPPPGTQCLTPVHMAVSLVARESVLLLLEHGPDMDAVDIKSSHLPLLHVVESKSLEMAELLIQRSTSVNAQSYAGCTALHAATGRGLLGVLRLLLRSGADCALKNYHNDTPLAVASSWQ
ncbi:poly [ADP-ribose] polymerase tankyrase-1-like, partial [Nyctibius grandis]|uniref:poly [ADP-ribose] polymerase tankyrase-1-like n=1 Tax=Nyctibius grandis TaxID=48427 RepID=UPI0035BC8A72